jgi:addiction module RelE/StbE family toxin
MPKLRVLYGDRFLRSARRLPETQQGKLARQLELVSENPFHPQLHTKPLTGRLTGLYAFRITRDWRVIFQFTAPDQIVLRDVGHRKDIYR